MATSEADIANLALGRIGQGTRLTSLDDASTPARWAKVFYGQVRDRVLEAGPWPFAMRRVSPAALSGVTRTGWDYAYSIPSDCIAVRGLNLDETGPSPALHTPFVIENEGGASGTSVILTNDDSPEIFYTARIESPSLFSPSFVEAVAWGLASDLSMPLSVKQDIALRAAQAAQLHLNRAKAMAFSGQQPAQPPESDFITAR